ncbi:sensor histidine kinase [Paenibacillus sp. TAB 01]|uniref:sensor histidine kinase n=1 Tax=Paenibacillus sp. TAB 01 TaxID=3368988 RepID=UPI003753B924
MKQEKKMRPFEKGSSIFQMVWLVYLISPIYSILQQPAHQMWVGLAVLSVFIAATLIAYWDVKRRLAYVLLMMAIIIYFCIYYDLNFWFLGFYCAPLIALLPSLTQFYVGMGSMLGLFAWVVGYHLNKFSADEMVIFLPSAILMFALPMLMRWGMRAKELRKKLNTANEEIARLIKNEERQRISRDLHDTLGHTLSLITLKSELAEKLIAKNPERAVQEVKDIQATSRAALKQVRELVSGMNAISVDQELRHAEQLLTAAGIGLTVRGTVESLDAPPLIQNILGMCLREAVTNVVKHSKAKHCRIELTAMPERIGLTISDDGVGSCCGKETAHASSSGRGLLGMKERLELIEGKLEFHSVHDSDHDGREPTGTTLHMTIPRIRKGDTGR